METGSSANTVGTSGTLMNWVDEMAIQMAMMTNHIDRYTNGDITSFIDQVDHAILTKTESSSVAFVDLVLENCEVLVLCAAVCDYDGRIFETISEEALDKIITILQVRML